MLKTPNPPLSLVWSSNSIKSATFKEQKESGHLATLLTNFNFAHASNHAKKITRKIKQMDQ